MMTQIGKLGWFNQQPTITDLMHSTIRDHLRCPNPDAVLNIETHLFNVTLQAECCTYDLDIGKDVWLNKGRWSRLIKEYVPRDNLERFIDNAVEIIEGKARIGATANMMFHDPARYAKKHRWGGCLMGATFRGDWKKAGKPYLTFYSRTTYIGYMGLLDAAIASTMAAEISKRVDWGKYNKSSSGLLSLGFRWHISSMQLHCFKTLPYIYSQPDLMRHLEKLGRNPKLIDKQPPTWRHIGKWYAKVVKGWTDYDNQLRGDLTREEATQAWLLTEKYGPFRRIKRRWCEHKGYLNKHVPPSLPVQALDFGKAVSCD